MTRTGDLLDRLDRLWLFLGVPVSDLLLPGLDADVIQAAVAPSGPDVHPTVVEWYSWHDGSRDDRWLLAPSGSTFTSMATTVEQRHRNLTMADPDDGPLWDPAWLPILAVGSSSWYSLHVETGVVLFNDLWAADRVYPVAASLDAAVTLWCDVLDTGAYQWSGNGWDYDFAALPRATRSTHLIG